MEDKRNVVFGKIELRDNKYVFVTKSDQVYNMPNNSQTAMLYNQNSLCSFELKENNPRFGKILEVFGEDGDPISEGRAIARKYNVDKPFSHDALVEAGNAPLMVTEDMIAGRRDYRNLDFVTIDPDTAKDYDDAVFGRKLPNGHYELKVAIADVSEIVKPDTKLFREAMVRGNSTYLGDINYSMLPKQLTEGICSLNEGVDRLVMCTSIEMTRMGDILKYTIEPAVINSSKRMTYHEAQDVYDGKIDTTEEIKDSIDNLYAISDALKAKRIERGALSIQEKENVFKLTSDRKGVEYVSNEAKPESTKVIESTAIVVNEVWDDCCQRLGIPFVSRVHEGLNLDHVEELRDKLYYLGIKTEIIPSHRQLQKICETYKDTKYEIPVLRTVLNSLTKAKYSEEHGAHAGLGIAPYEIEEKTSIDEKEVDKARKQYMMEAGSPYGFTVKAEDGKAIITHGYGHTTSPIRRGADDLNHINVKSTIVSGEPYFTKEDLQNYVDHLNDREVNAIKAESEYGKLLGTIWAKDHIGEKWSGTITLCLKDGLIANVSNGLNIFVPMEELEHRSNGMFANYEKFAMIEPKKGRTAYRVGDDINAKITSVKGAPYFDIIASEKLEKVMEVENDDLSKDDLDLLKSFEMSDDTSMEKC